MGKYQARVAADRILGDEHARVEIQGPLSPRVIFTDPQREVLAGVTFVGPEVADFLHAATIVITGEVALSRLAHAIPAFPARSELWLKFIEADGL